MNTAELEVLINDGCPKVTRERVIEAYKTFYASQWGQVILADLLDYFDPLAELHAQGEDRPTEFIIGTHEPIKHIIRRVVESHQPEPDKSNTYTKGD